MNKIILFLTVAFMSGCVHHSIHPDTIRDSFVLVKKKTTINVCGGENKTTVCKKLMDFGSVGSGAVVHNERALMKDPRTLILTANHVCQTDKVTLANLGPGVIPHIKDNLKLNPPYSLEVINEMKVQNQFGRNFIVKNRPWIQNEQADTCVIETSMSAPSLKIGTLPEFGDELYNIAAPKGIFHSSSSGGGVFFTKGSYNGRFLMDKDKLFAMYSINAAPGSSGSPVLNKNGELIGMIHSVDSRFCSRIEPICHSIVSYGATRRQVVDTIKGALSAIRRGKPARFDYKQIQ